MSSRRFATMKLGSVSITGLHKCGEFVVCDMLGCFASSRRLGSTLQLDNKNDAVAKTMLTGNPTLTLKTQSLKSIFKKSFQFRGLIKRGRQELYLPWAHKLIDFLTDKANELLPIYT